MAKKIGSYWACPFAQMKKLFWYVRCVKIDAMARGLYHITFILDILWWLDPLLVLSIEIIGLGAISYILNVILWLATMPPIYL